MKNKLFLLLFLVINPFISFGQYQHLQFYQMTTEDGLPSSTVNCIHQDSKGFMWFGTYNGLARYNGYEFDIFRVENDNPYSISGNRITAIHEDKYGLLWIGTWQAGINVFDPKTERFTNFKDGEDKITNRDIRSIAEDEKGNIWVGTLGGLKKLNRKDSTFNYFTDNSTIDNQPVLDITSLQIDEKQNIWIGSIKSGITILNTKTETYTTIDTLCGESMYTEYPKKFYFDKSGILWILTNGKGIYSYDKSNEKLTHFDYDIKSNISFANHNFTNMIEDHQGNLWFSADGEGLIIYEPKNKEFTFIKNSNNEIGGLNSNSIYTLFEDNTNIIWLGTFSKGVNIYDPNKKKFEQFHDEISLQITTKGESVLSLFEDSKKNIWAGTDGGGLFKLDNKTKQISHYKHDAKDPYSLSTNVIKSIYEDEKGMIWLGTWAFGIDIFDPTTERKIDNINIDNSPIKSNNIWFMHEDSYDDLWISTLGFGLSKKNMKDNQYDSYSLGMLMHNNMMSILEDENKNLWIGTEGNGFNIYDRDSNQFKHHYILSEKCPETPCNDIRTIYQDKAGQILLGTEGAGILVMQSPSDTFQLITTDDGLPSNTIHGILEDEEGNYWISSTKGITKYNTETKELKNFSKADGLQSDEFNYTSSLLTSSGKMIFGGVNGLNIFEPSRIKDNLNPPTVVIIGFSLFNQPIKALDESGLLKKSIYDTDEIVLQHNQSVIEFTFSALNYTLSEKNNYAYMMEGFDEEWTYAGSKRAAKYTSLDPGTYTFKVKASNNDGIWNEEGTSINIIILPPFWATWWFRTLALLLIICALFLFIKNRINRFKEESKKLEKLVNEKTEELVAQNEQIVDSIKYAKKIQMAILPPEELIREKLPDFSVFYEAKDIVSGDFYWMTEKEDIIYFAAVDCTGHGVPGAFMSIVGYRMLELIINVYNVKEPSEVLDELHLQVLETLHKQKGVEDDIKDGMDIALCAWDKKTRTLKYAGAHNPLYLIRDAELIEYTSDARPIGMTMKKKYGKFSQHEINIQKGDIVYIFTDGFADQFGGEKFRKYYYLPFQNFLMSISSKTMVEQQELLKEEFFRWKGDNQQIDDVLVFGVKF